VTGALDETGQEKTGTATAGVQRQYPGCAGKVANGISTVHRACVLEHAGHALTGARQWIPAAQIADPARSAAAGLPPGLEFRTRDSWPPPPRSTTCSSAATSRPASWRFTTASCPMATGPALHRDRPRQEGRPVLCGQEARAPGPVRLAAHEAIVCRSRTGGTCRGIPPLRREPYAGLRRVSHDRCPERSRRPGRRVLARRLRPRADRRGARGHRPGRSQDDHQRTELRREDRHGRLREQQHGDVRQPGHRAA
jgi:DDE superfamily endonuclease